MSVALSQILALVGKLDDAAGDEVPRERFRRFLRDEVNEVGQARDYIAECLRVRESGDQQQYGRALQDLVNQLGRFLGFTEITFGRYQGVQGEIGFDGLWVSPTGFSIVVEVKTSQVYAINTSTLLGYINDLISAQRIPSLDVVLGLYVVGRPDPETKQLRNAILAEKQRGLRIVSVEALLSLAELKSDYDVSHEDVLAMLRPSEPEIDPLVNLMARLVAPREVEVAAPPSPPVEDEGQPAYWMTPVKSDDEQTAQECISNLVGRHHVYAFGERTPGRKHLKRGDGICFYEAGNGVVAHARVRAAPERKSHPQIRQPDRYPWLFELDSSKLYLDKPVVLDPSVRGQLEAFKDRDLSKGWAWFVQSTRSITKHDFNILTSQSSVD